MKVYGGLDLTGNLLKNTGIEPGEFPAVPKVGTFVYKQKRLYVCVEIESGVPLYVPMTQELDLVTFVQSSPAMEWSIPHDLNTSDVMVQVYGTDGEWFLPNSINTSSKTQVIVGFSQPTAGRAILLTGENVGQPKGNVAYEESFTNSDTWVVNHSLGFNPAITCIINGYVALPEDIQYSIENMQATVTWSSPQTGAVRCV